MADLSGKTIAFLVAPEGIEQIELTEPWQAVEPFFGNCLFSFTTAKNKKLVTLIAQ